MQILPKYKNNYYRMYKNQINIGLSYLTDSEKAILPPSIGRLEFDRVKATIFSSHINVGHLT